MRARIAAHTRWSRASAEDRKAQSDALRVGTIARFEREVDPDGTLTAAERQRRAHAAEQAHMARMALASSKARRNARGPK